MGVIQEGSHANHTLKQTKKKKRRVAERAKVKGQNGATYPVLGLQMYMTHTGWNKRGNNPESAITQQMGTKENVI